MNLKDKCPLVIATKLNTDADKVGKLYLFNPDTTIGYELNGLASVFVNKFDGVKNVQKLISELEMEFELETGKFEKDVEKLISDLEHNGLISFSNSRKSK